MNKKLIVWTIIVVIVMAIIGLIAYAITNKDSSDNSPSGGLEVNSDVGSNDGGEDSQDEDNSGLATADDDFQEIENSMNYIG